MLTGVYQPRDEETPQGSGVLTLALEAAAAGLAVFPLRGKIPAIGKCPEAKTQGLTGEALAAHARTCGRAGHGFHDASRDPARITAMFNTKGGRSATGYGIATGTASGVVVVDVDDLESRKEAERLGLTSGYVVRSGRESDGWHIYFHTPTGVELKTRDIAPGLLLKAGNGYVVGPGSIHPDTGRPYRAAKGGGPGDASPAPAWFSETETSGGSGEASTPRGDRSPVVVDAAGPAIPEGERNVGLARVAGRLHDGTRTLDDLIRDLTTVSESRCTPPLPAGEVEKIARSIYSKPPCNPAPKPTPWVEAAIEYLRSVDRPVQGMGGATGWAVYHALLDRAARYGREHEQGVALSVDMRTAAQQAATNPSTVSRWLKRTSLVSVLRPGSGRRATLVVLRVPSDEGHQLQQLSTRVATEGHPENRSVASSALHRTLYRLRWSGGSTKARAGVVKGTSKVRQARQTPWDGLKRLGKSKAAVLGAVVECGEEGSVSRADLAARLGRNPAGMRKPLRELVEAGLLVKKKRGYYAAPEDLAERLADARELGREAEADRLQIEDHARQRRAYHNPVEAERAPTEREMRERRESYPARRRAATERAIAALFREHPEYRGRRVGQITARLVHYIPEDFPRGPDGPPKDSEVSMILDGEVA
jgi:hypothetical protein